MRRIGIFGGSFSPPHAGHAAIVEAALSCGLLDEVWLMPAARNPLKTEPNAFDDESRLAMLRLMAAYIERGGRSSVRPGSITVKDTELGMPVPSYTIDTMRKLRSENPDADFRLIIGEDSMAGFERWKEAATLLRDYRPIVYPRNFGNGEPAGREGFTMLENVMLHDVSSTAVREQLAKGEIPYSEMPWMKGEEYLIWKN